MAQKIIFEGVEHTFPDDFTDAEIAASLQGPSEYRNLPAPKDPGFDAGQMVRNIPGSAWQFAKDITQPIRHPIDTAKGVAKLAAGTAELAMPGEQGAEPYARAVGQGLKERYGGTQALRRTLQNDPVGSLADVAGLVTGGASLAGRAGLRGASTVGKVGRMMDPLAVPLTLAGNRIPASLPRRAMTSAAKLRTSLPTADRAKIVETMLEHGAMPTEGGVAKLVGAQEGLSQQIDDLIAQAGATGGAVPASAVFTRFKDLRQKLGGPRLNAAENLADIDAVARKFMQHLKNTGQTRLTIEDLQKLKTDAWQQVNWNKSKQTGTRATEEATKAAGQGARAAIERRVPQIADVNRKWGDIEQAIPEVERAAGRVGNRDFMGIGVPIKAGVGASLGGAPGAAIGSMFGGLDTPRIKSWAAIQAEALRKRKLTDPTWTTARAAAAQAGRLPEDQQE